MKRNIIICGFPKSGNTWLTRLTAQLVDCPVAGFWLEPFNEEQAIEGSDRQSPWRCFKAHHPLKLLQRSLEVYGNGNDSIIYIYRDPRSIACSAAKYFKFKPQYKFLFELLSFFPNGIKLYENIFHNTTRKLNIVVNGLIKGSNQIPWFAYPWSSHVQEFTEESRVLSLSYEALRSDSLVQCRRICDFLSLNRTIEEIEKTILDQEFDKKKRILIEQGLTSKARLLRKGSITSWKNELPAANIKQLEISLGPIMRQMGYNVTHSAED
jgi:hypothetical protein